MKWLLIMLPCVALAGIWPSQDSIMQGGFDRGNQVLSGAVERLSVVAGPTAWQTYATTNIWKDYFKQRTKIVAAKNMLGAAVDYGLFTFPSGAWNPTNSIIVTRSNLADRIGAGQNWFTNTPSFNVATDTNGFVLMPSAMSNVVWLFEDSYSFGAGVSNDAILYWSGLSASSFDDALANMSGPYTNTTKQGYAYSSVQTWINGAYYVVAARESGDFYWHYLSASVGAHITNYAAAVDVWFAANASIFDNNFDAQGDDVSTNWTKMITFSRSVGDTKASSSVRIPQTPNTNLPTSYIAATNATIANNGWSSRAAWNYVHRFNDSSLTNGFKWFK